MKLPFLSKKIKQNINPVSPINNINNINIKNIESCFYKQCLQSQLCSKCNHIDKINNFSKSDDMIRISKPISRIGDYLDNMNFKIDFNNYFNNNIYNAKQLEEFCYNLFTNLNFNIVAGYEELCNNNIIKINPSLFYNTNYVVWNKNYMIVKFKQFIKDYLQMIKCSFTSLEYIITINLLNCKTKYMNNIKNDISNDTTNYSNNITSNDMITLYKFNNFIENCSYSMELNYIYFDTQERDTMMKDDKSYYFLPINYYISNDVNIKKETHRYEYNFNLNNIIKHKYGDNVLNNDLLYILFSFSNKYNELKNFEGTVDILINNNNVLNNSKNINNITNKTSSISTKSTTFYKHEYLNFFSKNDSLSNNGKYDTPLLPMALNFQLHPELDYFTGCLNRNNIQHIQSIKFIFNGEFTNLEAFETELKLNVMLAFKFNLLFNGTLHSCKDDNLKDIPFLYQEGVKTV